MRNSDGNKDDRFRDNIEMDAAPAWSCGSTQVSCFPPDRSGADKYCSQLTQELGLSH